MSSVKAMELRGNFQLQKLFNRIGLLKGKIEQSKKLPKLFSMKQNYRIRFGENLFTQQSTYLTEDNSQRIRIRPPMSCGMEDQPQSNILKCLEVTVTSKEMRMTLEILTLGLMKESFQDTHPPKRHIGFAIKGYIKLQKVLI